MRAAAKKKRDKRREILGKRAKEPFRPVGAIGDQTYIDVNQDSEFNTGDEVFAGVTVDLFNVQCPADLATLPARVDRAVTDANGLYLFTEVPDGDYCVTATSANTGEAFEGKYGQEVEVQGGEELSAEVYDHATSRGIPFSLRANQLDLQTSVNLLRPIFQ
mgnify:CR=1 FL=1